MLLHQQQLPDSMEQLLGLAMQRMIPEPVLETTHQLTVNESWLLRHSRLLQKRAPLTEPDPTGRTEHHLSPLEWWNEPDVGLRLGRDLIT